MSDDTTNYTEEELEELEEKLLAEEEREREEIMPVSGKSVFDVQRIKRREDVPEKGEDGE